MTELDTTGKHVWTTFEKVTVALAVPGVVTAIIACVAQIAQAF